MNIVIVLSGGVGKRYGAVIPKQYTLINNKPIIDYVLDEVEKSKSTDKLIVVMDKQWKGYSNKLSKIGCDFVENGIDRHKSLYNALKHVKDNYSCEKIVVLDAVAPFITGDIIDDYFEKLNNYDSVITARSIIGSLTDKNNGDYNRDDFIITESPEAFKFNLLYENYDPNFIYGETAGMLPKNCTRYYNYDFYNNRKLTYDYDLDLFEFLLSKDNIRYNYKTHFDKEILFTDGIKKSLLINNKNQTIEWINSIYDNIYNIISEYNITSFVPNQMSNYGLVLHCDSKKYGKIILKFIPELVDRYKRELEAYKFLPKSYMCDLIDYNENLNLLVIKEIINSKYAIFEDNIKLTRFFNKVFSDKIPYTSQKVRYIIDYYDEMLQKIDNINKIKYCKEEIRDELNFAKQLFDKYFVNDIKYIIHLDLHNLNILDDGDNYFAIDPNGSIAPFEFEFVKFIRNDLRNNINFNTADRFEILRKYFSKYVDYDKLGYAFLIDLAVCNYNSNFENFDDAETVKNCTLFNTIKEIITTYDKK